MARICYEADKEVAYKDLLRLSIIAKLFKVAPKTVNAWTKYSITKVRGVKYLNWSEVRNDKIQEAELMQLPILGIDAYNLITTGHVLTQTKTEQSKTVSGYKPQVATAADTALSKAKALLNKDVKMDYITHTGAGVNVGEYKPLKDNFKGVSTVKPPEIIIESDEILSPHFEVDDVLTVKDDYRHMLKK